MWRLFTKYTIFDKLYFNKNIWFSRNIWRVDPSFTYICCLMFHWYLAVLAGLHQPVWSNYTRQNSIYTRCLILNTVISCSIQNWNLQNKSNGQIVISDTLTIIECNNMIGPTSQKETCQLIIRPAWIHVTLAICRKFNTAPVTMAKSMTLRWRHQLTTLPLSSNAWTKISKMPASKTTNVCKMLTSRLTDYADLMSLTCNDCITKLWTCVRKRIW